MLGQNQKGKTVRKRPEETRTPSGVKSVPTHLLVPGEVRKDGHTSEGLVLLTHPEVPEMVTGTIEGIRDIEGRSKNRPED